MGVVATAVFRWPAPSDWRAKRRTNAQTAPAPAGGIEAIWLERPDTDALLGRSEPIDGLRGAIAQETRANVLVRAATTGKQRPVEVSYFHRLCTLEADPVVSFKRDNWFEEVDGRLQVQAKQLAW